MKNQVCHTIQCHEGYLDFDLKLPSNYLKVLLLSCGPPTDDEGFIPRVWRKYLIITFTYDEYGEGILTPTVRWWVKFSPAHILAIKQWTAGEGV